MPVVTRPIVTHPSNPDYDAGWVFTYKRCPVCREPLDVTHQDDYSMESWCMECDAQVNVDMRRVG